MSTNEISEIRADQFFSSLSSFYRPLFSSEKPLWSALDQIRPFLEGMKLGIHEGTISEKAHLENPSLITVCRGAVIEPFAYVKGPCWIGEGAEVRQGAYLRGMVIVGEKAIAGHGTEIKNSLLFPNVHADHFVYIGDSIIGEGSHLGAGVILANLRLDKGEIMVARMGSGRKKLGAIIGERVEIGCNTVINPGSILFSKSRVFPQLNWGGVLLSGQEVRGDRLKSVH